MSSPLVISGTTLSIHPLKPSPLIQWATEQGLEFKDGAPYLDGLSLPAIATLLTVEYSLHFPKAEYLPGERDFIAQISLHREQLQIAFEDSLREKMKCGGEDLEPAKSLLRAIIKNPSEADVAVFCHLLSCIKRALYNQKINRSMLPNFYGHQGTGKTEFLRRLLHPFEKMVMWDATVVSVCEPASVPALAKNIAVVLTELRSSRAEMSALKAVIDAQKISYRIFYTQNFETIQKRAQLISTSNFPMNELLPPDPTGMRRFYELVCDATFDREAINKICLDPKFALWKGIPERAGDKFFDDAAPAIRAAQEKLVAVDPLDEFLGELGLSPVSEMEAGSAWIRVDHLWRHFKLWSESNNAGKAYSSSWLSQRLKNRCLAKSRTRLKDGGRTTLFRMKPDAPDNGYIRQFGVADDGGSIAPPALPPCSTCGLIEGCNCHI